MPAEKGRDSGHDDPNSQFIFDKKKITKDIFVMSFCTSPDASHRGSGVKASLVYLGFASRTLILRLNTHLSVFNALIINPNQFIPTC